MPSSPQHPECSHPIAACLVGEGLLTIDAIPTLLSTAQQNKIPFITHLVRANILSSESILSCCAKKFAMPVYDLSGHEIKIDHIPPDFILRYRILPLFRQQNVLHIGMSDPTDHTAISAIQFHTGLSISPRLVCEAALDKILTRLSRTNRLGAQLESALSKITPIEDTTSRYSITEADDGPMSEFVERLIDDAVAQQASDIHIEPFPDHCRIRFRRDGLLSEVASTPPHFAARLITRLKILSQLNIAERRLPQDGRLALPSSSLDIRINTCPTLSGEKIVLRLLNANKTPLDIESLGLSAAQQSLFLSKLTQPQGLILVTGPTGSGKTLTLYSALNYLNHIEKNISSVEDPIEIELAGINQISINPRIGFDFAVALRALLRQDPDIIMIGEIRDTHTATIAMQAAQTGHLVLSTLHTNNAIETISRLQFMGTPMHHLIGAISLIIAQRLVRKLCPHCKKLTKKKFYLPIGCEHCHHGYQGRIGVFECMPITEKIISSILSGSNLQDALKKEQWLSLWDAGMSLVQHGITSYAELLRVIGSTEDLCSI
jgi:type IV pilus assembly protein PilB